MSTLQTNIRHFFKFKLFYYSVELLCAELIETSKVSFRNFQIFLVNVDANIDVGKSFFIERKPNKQLNGY